MAKLAKRLARQREQRARQPLREGADSSPPTGRPPTSGPPTSGQPSSTRARRLEALRARMRRMVGVQPSLPAPPPRRPSGARLPFDTIATQAGELHVRTVFITPAQRMGSVALSGALRADSLMLSLLALDPSLAGCDLRKVVFLDAETTGLGTGTGNYPFLMGVCSVVDGGLVLHQYLLRDPCEEPAMLARMFEHIEGADLIVSFNGKSFDVPLLRNRFVMNRMRAPREPPHLDLLHVARRIHKRRPFRKSLTTLEREVLGFRRAPNDVAGAEVAQRYLHYLHSREESELADVVEHNELDVLTLVALTALYGEPLTMLAAEELASIADVVRRAGDLERARAIADEAVRRGAIEAGLMSRAFINKARGDRQQALVDFEQLADRVDDPDVRLELAKLYEHDCRDHETALACTLSGTGEKPADQARRRARLERKLSVARTRSSGLVGRPPFASSAS